MSYDPGVATDTLYDHWLPAFSSSMLEAYADRFYEEISAAIIEARAAAFEEAAKKAEGLKDGPGLDSEWYVATAKDAAAAIRSLAVQERGGEEGAGRRSETPGESTPVTRDSGVSSTPLSAASEPEPLRCLQCGKDVEEQRRCYAVPVCYGCLPPPPPLPIASRQFPAKLVKVPTKPPSVILDEADLAIMPSPSKPKYVCPMKRPSGAPKNCGMCRSNGRDEPGECYCCGADLIPSAAPNDHDLNVPEKDLG